MSARTLRALVVAHLLIGLTLGGLALGSEIKRCGRSPADAHRINRDGRRSVARLHRRSHHSRWRQGRPPRMHRRAPMSAPCPFCGCDARRQIPNGSA